MSLTTAHTVAIVGTGPKGLHCLERLIAQYHAASLQRPLHVHLFNRNADFGASPIYDPAQPEYILVNVPVGEVNLWGAEEPPIFAGKGPNFIQWYEDTFHPTEPLTGGEYLSRAVVGRYLREGFQRLAGNPPPNLELFCHVGEVVDLWPDGSGYRLEYHNARGVQAWVLADQVLLATGHSRLLPGEEEQTWQAFSRQHQGTSFIPFVYPVVEVMGRIPTEARVAMKGIGLTFIDAVLELTEGRGGRFERGPDGVLTYFRSGAEPVVIYPYSRTGLPMTPKAVDLPTYLRPLTFFTLQVLAELGKASGGKLRFDGPLWELFELEMARYYYQWAMGHGEDRDRLEACGNDGAAMRRVIEGFLNVHPEVARFDYRPILDPVGTRQFADRAAYTAFIGQYMAEEIARARRGYAGCGFKSAIDIWYEVRYVLSEAMQSGGLTPESHRELLEHYHPRLKRVVFGPPIINIEKLHALLAAGLLDFSVARNPQVTTCKADGCFQLECDAIPGPPVKVQVLVDGRYPGINIPRDASPLYRNLYRRGLVRAFENQAATPGEPGYCPGAIDHTKDTHFVIDRDGVVNRQMVVIGIPTEGNLLGNFTIVPSKLSALWAKEIVDQLADRKAVLETGRA